MKTQVCIVDSLVSINSEKPCMDPIPHTGIMRLMKFKHELFSFFFQDTKLE